RVTRVLDRAGAFVADKRDAKAEDYLLREVNSVRVLDLNQLLGLLEQADVAKRGAEGLKTLSAEERETLQHAGKRLTQFRVYFSDKGFDPREMDKLKESAEFGAWLKRLRQERDETARKLDEADVELASRWKSLRECCAQLECLSHKQLRGR